MSMLYMCATIVVVIVVVVVRVVVVGVVVFLSFLLNPEPVFMSAIPCCAVH